MLNPVVVKLTLFGAATCWTNVGVAARAGTLVTRRIPAMSSVVVAVCINVQVRPAQALTPALSSNRVAMLVGSVKSAKPRAYPRIACVNNRTRRCRAGTPWYGGLPAHNVVWSGRSVMVRNALRRTAVRNIVTDDVSKRSR
jgi:hypothetical protein